MFFGESNHRPTVGLLIQCVPLSKGKKIDNLSQEMKHKQKNANWKVKPEDATGGLTENTEKIHVV